MGILVSNINGYCTQTTGMIVECGGLGDINPVLSLTESRQVDVNITVGALPEEYKVFENNTLGKLYAMKNKDNKFILQETEEPSNIEVLPISEGYFKIGSDGKGVLNTDDIYSSDNVDYAKYDTNNYYLLDTQGQIPTENKKEVKVIDLRNNTQYFFYEDNIFENTGKTTADLKPAVLDLNGHTLTVNNQIIDGNNVPSTIVMTQLGTTGPNPGTIDLGKDNILSIEPGAIVGNGEEKPVTVNNGVLDLCKFFNEEGKLSECANIAISFGNSKPAIKLFDEENNTLEQLEKVMQNYGGTTLFPNIDFGGETPNFTALSSSSGNIINCNIVKQLFNLSEEALEQIETKLIAEDFDDKDKLFNVIDHVNANNEFQISSILDSLIDKGVLVANGVEETNVLLTKQDCQKITSQEKTLASIFQDGFKGTVTITNDLTSTGEDDDPEVKVNIGGISLNLAFLEGGKISDLMTGTEAPEQIKYTTLNMKGKTLTADKIVIPANTRLKLKNGTLVLENIDNS